MTGPSTPLFAADYARLDTLADLFRQISYDERVHKHESVAAMQRPRFKLTSESSDLATQLIAGELQRHGVTRVGWSQVRVLDTPLDGTRYTTASLRTRGCPHAVHESW